MMLGDTLPWFFPMLALCLCLWLTVRSIEKGAAKKSVGSFSFMAQAVIWAPPVMFGWLFLHRFVAIVRLDMSHLEVLQYLNEGSSFADRLVLVATGQSAFELAAFSAVLFAACSHRLPSVQTLGVEAARMAKHRMMMFTSLCLLMSFSVLFPEQAYTSPQPLPQQTIGELPPLSDAMLPLLFSLMVMFAGEVFAASSTYSIGADFSVLAKKASLKCAVLAAAAFAWISTGPTAWIAWNEDPTAPTELIALLMIVHAAVALVFVVNPSKTIESRLMHGERRSYALLATFASVAFLTILSTCLLLNSHSLFGNTTGAYLYGFWLSTAVLGSMLLAQFMPTLGFDAAPRPEAWWLRISAVFMPMLVMTVAPMGAYLIPGVWLAMAWTLVIPWMVEADVQSPSLGFVIGPLTAATVAGLVIPLLASNPFYAAIPLMVPALAIAVLGMLVHKPLANKKTF
jgi:hypothetical protein